MNIAIIANGYPTCREPQFGCFEKDQALALQRAGHKVSILYVDARFRKFWRKIGINHFIENDIHVYSLFLFPMALVFKISFKLHYWLRKHMLNGIFGYLLKKEGKPDIIYAHFLYNISFAAYLKNKHNIPLVGMEHWSVLTLSELSSDVKYYGKIAYQSADRIIAVSNSLKKQINKHFQINAIVVYNMLGLEFVKNSLEIIRDRKKFRFIAIGSLIHRKGFDLLISAFKKSGLNELCCEVIIIGGGEDEKMLQNQINKLGVPDSVTLVGQKNKQEIIHYLKNSDVFVFPSRAETFGVVCIEALSLGVPIIATECGGPEEFVQDDNGLLIQTNSISDLAFAMKNIFENYSKYDPMLISSNCINRFSPLVITKQLTTIFENVVAKYHSNK